MWKAVSTLSPPCVFFTQSALTGAVILLPFRHRLGGRKNHLLLRIRLRGFARLVGDFVPSKAEGAAFGLAAIIVENLARFR